MHPSKALGGWKASRLQSLEAGLDELMAPFLSVAWNLQYEEKNDDGETPSGE